MKPFTDIQAFFASSAVMLVVVELIKLIASYSNRKASSSSTKKNDDEFTKDSNITSNNNNNTRKILHISAGLIFTSTLPFFPNPTTPYTHIFASLVPLSMTFKFILVGLTILPSKADIEIMSRSGSPAELLKGPMIYGLTIFILTSSSFRTVQTNAAVLSLCLGDGFAEVVGSAYGQMLSRVPWNARKSVVGSIACFLGCVGSVLIAIYIDGDSSGLLIGEAVKVSVISGIVGAVVESLPIQDFDNLTLPLSVFGAVKLLV